MLPDTSENWSGMSMTRNKRDEFLIEIRRSKNSNLLKQKRFQGFEYAGKNNNSIQEEKNIIFGENSTFASTNDKEQKLSGEFLKELEIVHKKFYELLNKEAWFELTMVLKYLRRHTIDNLTDVFIQAVIDMGIIPHILHFLNEDFIKEPALQIEAAWLLANFTAGSTEGTLYLVNQNIIPVFAKTLIFENEELHENAMWALANIASEEDLKFRDMILDKGVLQEMVRQLIHCPRRRLYTRTAIWFISILVRGKPFPSYEKVKPCLTIIAQLIHNDDDLLMQEYAIQSLSCLTESKDEATIKEITNYGFIPKVIKFVSNEDERIVTNALKILGNLAFNESEVTQELVNHNIFQILYKVLNSRNKVHRNEACYILSNIITERFKEHNYFILHDIMPIVIERLSDDPWQIISEATVCVKNYVWGCSLEDIQILVTEGVLTPLLKNLQHSSKKIVEQSLISLHKIFAHGEELKKARGEGENIFVTMILQGNAGHFIEALQDHPDQTIYQLTAEVLDSYFPMEPL